MKRRQQVSQKKSTISGSFDQYLPYQDLEYFRKLPRHRDIRRQEIRNSVLQGDTFGKLLAAVQVDTIAQEVEKAGVGYMYKEELPVNTLGLVDDIVGVSEAGYQAQVMNTILNIKTAEQDFSSEQINVNTSFLI